MVLVVSLMSFQSPFLSVVSPESAVLEAILKHRRLISEAVRQGMELKCFTPEEQQLAEAVKEVRWGEKLIVPESSTRLMPGTVSFLREAPDSAECLLPAEPHAELTLLCFLILPTLGGW